MTGNFDQSFLIQVSLLYYYLH